MPVVVRSVAGQGGIDGEFDIDSLAAISTDSDSLSEQTVGGTALGLDLGLLFTPKSRFEPTIGLSVTDFGGSTFSKAKIGGASTSAPKTRLSSVNTGFSLKAYKTEKMFVRISCDAHSINQYIHYSHKLNFGVEYGYLSILRVQAGLKEGYLTGGVSIDAKLLQIRLATYFVDHAPVVGTHENLVEQRFAFQMKLLI